MLSYPRAELIQKISNLSRYIACSRVTKRPVFDFVDFRIRPSDALQVFPLSDDYSFGILQSHIHWIWFTACCSTLKGDFRYTSNTVFNSFPFPQSPTLTQIKIELSHKMLSIVETQKLWQPLAHRLVIPRDEASYQQLVEWLDLLIDEVGEDEQHPLASLMDILGILIENYENEHIPELQG